MNEPNKPPTAAPLHGIVMRWPRGKYNGRRIIGVSFKISLAVDEWRWKPVIGNHCGMFHWLFWRSWTQWEYDHR
jgi:hypothetical protein